MGFVVTGRTWKRVWRTPVLTHVVDFCVSSRDLLPNTQKIIMEDKPKKKFYKKPWFWIVVIVVLFIIGSSDQSTTPAKVVNSTDATVKQKAQEDVFKIGDQIKSGDALLTVTKVTKNWKSSNQYDKPSSPDDVYVLVTIAIENKGDKDLSLSGIFDFKLEDANGLQKSSTLGGIGIKQLPTGSLSPNGKATGDIIFDVDKNALGTLKLHYEPMFSFDKEVVVELQ